MSTLVEEQDAAVSLATNLRREREARGWTLTGSLDGVTFTTLASGTGTGQLTTVDVPHSKARFLRITSTGSSGSWWSIADLRLYRLV